MSKLEKTPSITVVVAAIACCITACSGGGSNSNNGNNQNNTNGQCPSGYVYVPGGTFTIGMDEEDVADLVVDWDHSMGPKHLVTLTSGFCISKTETTVAQYRSCRNSGKCTGESPSFPPFEPGCTYSETDQALDDHPINCLTYEQAREYCIAQGGDLPTEAQWFRAAQGEDRRLYPWGADEPTCLLGNYDPNGLGDTEPNGWGCAETLVPPFTWVVGTAPDSASPYGVLNMAGNVSEFVQGCAGQFEVCDGELGCSDPQPESCDGVDYRLALGGCYASAPWNMYVFPRDRHVYGRKPDIGVRCAMAASSN